MSGNDKKEISNSGFGVNTETTDTHGKNQDQKSAVRITNKRPFYIGGGVLALIVVVTAFQWPSGSNDLQQNLIQSEAESTVIKSNAPSLISDVGKIGNEKYAAGKSSHGDATVTHDPDNGVTVNGYNDRVASMLLQNYPTKEQLRDELIRVRGADVSKAELSVFLLAVKNNSDDIKTLLNSSASSSDNKAMAAALKDMRSAISELRIELRDNSKKQQTELQGLIDSMEVVNKNSGWYHNRISKLESNPQVKATVNPAVTSPKVESNVSLVRRVEVNAESMWSVNGASQDVAFIENISTKQKLRVTRGFDIPGCGLVTDINPSLQSITSVSCIIAN